MAEQEAKGLPMLAPSCSDRFQHWFMVSKRSTPEEIDDDLYVLRSACTVWIVPVFRLTSPELVDDPAVSALRPALLGNMVPLAGEGCVRTLLARMKAIAPYSWKIVSPEVMWSGSRVGRSIQE